MNVIICGDRNWTNRRVIASVFRQLILPDDVIIQGGNGYLESGRVCRDDNELLQATRGADALAYQVACQYMHKILTFWPNWTTHRRAAGPIRNQQMLMVEQRPRLVIAFHDDIRVSKGTRDMLRRAAKASIPWRLFNSKGEEVEQSHES